MGEASSDYFAASRFNHTIIGDYLFDRSTRGIRRSPIDESELRFEDLGNEGFEPHNDGEIFSATLWDIRGALGGEAADRLILSAVKLTPCPATFVDARRALLLVDQNTNDSRDRETLWRIFAARGLGFSADAADAMVIDPAGTVFSAAYDLPEDLQRGNTPPHFTSRPSEMATFGEPFSYQARAVDPDGGTLRYGLLDGPAGATVDSATGKISWTGNFSGGRFVIEVTDGNGGRAAWILADSLALITLGRPITIDGPAFRTASPSLKRVRRLISCRSPCAAATVKTTCSSEALRRAMTRDRRRLWLGTETLTFADAEAGFWVAFIYRLGTDYEDVRLEARSVKPVSLDLDSPVEGLSGPRTSQTFYEVEVPAGAERLRVTTAGGGDADIYMARGRIARCSFYDDRPCDFDKSSGEDGSLEIVDIPTPEPGKYSIQILGFFGYDDLDA